MFMILAGTAAYYSAANVIQTLYYAGRDVDSFNVGKFVRTSPITWEIGFSQVLLSTGRVGHGIGWCGIIRLIMGQRAQGYYSGVRMTEGKK
jgi:hypothetical protein